VTPDPHDTVVPGPEPQAGPGPSRALLSVLLWIEAVGGVAFAVMLVALTRGTRSFLGELEPAAEAVMTAVSAASLLFGIAAATAAVGVWRGRGWAWALASVLQALVILGCLAALTTGGWVPALWLALLPALAGIALLATPGVRPAAAPPPA
jgi:hypothetical protein